MKKGWPGGELDSRARTTRSMRKWEEEKYFWSVQSLIKRERESFDRSDPTITIKRSTEFSLSTCLSLSLLESIFFFAFYTDLLVVIPFLIVIPFAILALHELLLDFFPLFPSRHCRHHRYNFWEEIFWYSWRMSAILHRRYPTMSCFSEIVTSLVGKDDLNNVLISQPYKRCDASRRRALCVLLRRCATLSCFECGTSKFSWFITLRHAVVEAQHNSHSLAGCSFNIFFCYVAALFFFPLFSSFSSSACCIKAMLLFISAVTHNIQAYKQSCFCLFPWSAIRLECKG